MSKICGYSLKLSPDPLLLVKNPQCRRPQKIWQSIYYGNLKWGLFWFPGPWNNWFPQKLLYTSLIYLKLHNLVSLKITLWSIIWEMSSPVMSPWQILQKCWWYLIFVWISQFLLFEHTIKKIVADLVIFWKVCHSYSLKEQWNLCRN